MSSTHGRMTDLFIPIGRPQSGHSTTRTNSSLDKTYVSGTVTSDVRSSPASTLSSRTSQRNETVDPQTSRSRSTTRYTISGPISREDAARTEVMPASGHQLRRPSMIHVRQQSGRSAAQTSPVKELTKRVSKATTDTTPETQPTFELQPKNGACISHTTMTPKSGSGARTPVEVTWAGPMSISAESSHHEHSRGNSGVQLGLPFRDRPSHTPRTESFPLHLVSTPILRSHSRSSSRSDRSCPPPSFPASFYERLNEQQARQETPSRPQHRRTSSLKPTDRSNSSLKHEPLAYDIRNGSPLAPRPGQHRRQSSDSNITSLSRASALSSATEHTSLSDQPIVHYYTTCPHASPPCTRPLNMLPVLEDNGLRSRSIIQGSCFNCDTADRRDSESEILHSFNTRIAAHTATLESIIVALESESSISSPSSSSFISEDDSPEVILIRLEVLQDRIEELRTQREQEVKDVWRGYTQRWGPGTLGIVKGIESDRLTLASTNESVPSPKRSLGSSRSNSYHGTAEGRMRVDWIRD